ncbi:GNAT family N-acetyltransferase [Microlunatus elymi]|uniref:GNAT family N-acetyltransferase n=1 Tax=Microlunatus elymi TaxID=2596828 RepID=A0A516PTS2_9ACTN|nr:GNAT family N-acetyltransferase [Microlunatus elymi]QDP94552.1 GNAT family N-acetyltransferase [Microlunatus elymi]
MPTIRPYLPTDQTSWLRCRVLSFLNTCYYDDVRRTRPHEDDLVVSLVAASGDEVVGLIDVTVDGSAATIDCIAIHPDHQPHGLGARLFEAALAELGSEVETIDAWTREDEAANRWYRSRGFRENSRYLHVYKDWDESVDAFSTPEPLSTPVQAFMQAKIEHEAELRTRFRRVYVCRQYLKIICPEPSTP